jgi:hypothetical protein
MTNVNIVNEEFINNFTKLVNQSIKRVQRENEDYENSDGSCICYICNGKYTTSTKTIHNRTKKHTKAINSITKKAVHRLNTKYSI